MFFHSFVAGKMPPQYQQNMSIVLINNSLQFKKGLKKNNNNNENLKKTKKVHTVFNSVVVQLLCVE